MDWIETTGRTIEEAKEVALDELGVDEQDAEFEVLAEPKTGLFGRMRIEGRIRARVRPTAPRPKEDRRDRRRKGRGDRQPSTAGASDTETAAVATAEPPAIGMDAATGSTAPVAATTGGASSNGGGRGRADRGATDDDASKRTTTGGNGRGPRRSADDAKHEKDDKMTSVDVPLEDQAEVAREFLTGLVHEFGLTADVQATLGEEDTVDLTVTGENLGLLIGPKGSTLLALQDLTRSAVQQKTNAGNGRIHVDVGGYRQKRSEALARFALQVAETVKQSGERQALEPMSAVDRKVIHDALTEFDGVSTVSEGEDANRRVVVVPASD